MEKKLNNDKTPISYSSKVSAKIEYPETYKLVNKCEWINTKFAAHDGIEEHTLWTFKGLIVALGFIDGDRQFIIGSGVMVAPGLCLTATHVIEELKEKNGFLYTFQNESSMNIWTLIDYHALQTQKSEVFILGPQDKYSDVSILSYIPFSKHRVDLPYLYAPLEVSLPKIGERLWAVGYREIHNDGVPSISFFITSGLVTEQYSKGRGAHLQGACIEVSMKAMGGMSGGPVFNEKGNVIGVISTCIEGTEDNKGPTYITLMWPAMTSSIYCPWPESLWPEDNAGLLTKIETNGAKVEGNAVESDNNSFNIKFPKISQNTIHAIFKKSGEPLSTKYNDLYEYEHELFDDYLEEEGLLYLKNLSHHELSQIWVEPRFSEQLKLFTPIDSETYDGVEDITINSATLLESGSIGLDISFDIQGVFLTLKMDASEYSYHKNNHSFSGGFHNFENHGDYITYQHYIRPYFRVTLNYNPTLELCEEIRFHMVKLM